jgi:hypothetical protein
MVVVIFLPAVNTSPLNLQSGVLLVARQQKM